MREVRFELRRDNRTADAKLVGCVEDYIELNQLQVARGRWLTPRDRGKKVVVLADVDSEFEVRAEVRNSYVGDDGVRRVNLEFLDGKKRTLTVTAVDEGGLVARKGTSEERVSWDKLTDRSAFEARKALTPFDDAAARLALSEFARERKFFPEAMEELEVALADDFIARAGRVHLLLDDDHGRLLQLDLVFGKLFLRRWQSRQIISESTNQISPARSRRRGRSPETAQAERVGHDEEAGEGHRRAGDRAAAGQEGFGQLGDARFEFSLPVGHWGRGIVEVGRLTFEV